MSSRFAVGTSPVQILYGTQDSPQIVLNSGTTSAYLSDDSNPSAGFDFTLGASESLVVDSETVMWATADSPGTTLTTLNNYGDRFVPSAPVGRLLQSVYIPQSQTFTFFQFPIGTGIASHFSSIYVEIVPPSTINLNTWPTGLYTLQFTENGVSNTAGDGAVHSASWYHTGASGVEVAGVPVMCATFPNFSGRGGAILLQTPGAVSFNGTINMYATDYPVQSTVIGTSQASTVLTGQTWTNVGNTWTCQPTITAGSATTDVYLPPITGPARVAMSLTQAGAGSLTANLRTLTGTAATSVQWDTLIASTAAGGLWAGATYGVWPTSPMLMRFVLAAGVTGSSCVLSITQGGA
jgi:hypothetical protein